MPVASQSVNGKNMDCGEETLSAVFALLSQSSLSSQMYSRIKIFLHLYSTPHLSSCTKSMRGWWKRKGLGRVKGKGFGRFSDESPARTREKGAQQGREELGSPVGKQLFPRCEITLPAPARRDAHKINLETSNLGSEMCRERQGETALASEQGVMSIWQPECGDGHSSFWG